MNNACYFRVAELARWRQTTQGGMLGPFLRNGWMFIIAEQQVTYKRPILPFQRFTVHSEISLDGKWIIYDQFFLHTGSGSAQFLREVNHTTQPIQYAHIRLKAVVKKSNGRTVMPEEVLRACPNVSAWIKE